jgi:hypothetical protein
MKEHVKILSLLAVASVSLLASADSASAAPTLTSPAGTEYTGTIRASLETASSALLKAGIENTCTESTFEGPAQVNNEERAEGSLTTVTFGKCTQDTAVISRGRLRLQPSGTVSTVESTVEVKVTGLGITCFYGPGLAPVDIGTLTPTGSTTFTAKLDVNTTELPRAPGSNTFFCASKATWTGSYIVTTPDRLYLS